MSLDEITKWVFKDEERRGVGTEHPNWRAGRPPKEAGKQGQWDRGKPGEWSPGAKEGSICRRREGPAVHHVLLRVKSKETELTTGLGSMKVFGDLDKGLPHVAFREKGRGRGHSEVSRRAPKGTAEWASWRGTWEAPGKEPFSPMCLYSSVRALFPPPGKSPAQGAASRSFWLLWSNWLLPA